MFVLPIIVFVSGGVLMVLELTGSRLLAPYVGTSMPVWTGLIGVILSSLSLGYWFGGRLADRAPAYTMLALILGLSSVSLGLIPILSKIFLSVLVVAIHDIRISGLLMSILLFSPASILLGMVSPYAVRLRIENIKTSGETAGNLYALSTIGSIAGTFLAGFFLIAFLGSYTIFYLLAAIMLFLSCLAYGKKWFKNLIYIFLLLPVMFVDYFYLNQLLKKRIDVDSQYNRITIYDELERQTGRTYREMRLGKMSSSAMYLDSDELVYPYTKYYRLVDLFVPHTKKALMIGGAGYSYPKDYIREHLNAQMDVVEIDPVVTQLARKYFRLRDGDRIHVFHEDARTFLNRREKKYDAIFLDVFSLDYSVPFQLTTQEAISNMYAMLDSNGVVIVNIISSVTGERNKLFRAEYYTYKSVFPHVAVFPVEHLGDEDVMQNVMIVASKKKLNLDTDRAEFAGYLSHLWRGEAPVPLPILTDDFAPVEFYAAQAVE